MNSILKRLGALCLGLGVLLLPALGFGEPSGKVVTKAKGFATTAQGMGVTGDNVEAFKSARVENLETRAETQFAQDAGEPAATRYDYKEARLSKKADRKSTGPKDRSNKRQERRDDRRTN